jgi:protein TonB
MIESKPKHRWLHAAAATALAIAFVAIACESPTPSSDGGLAEAPSEAPSPPNVAVAPNGDATPDAEPAYIPRDQEPVVTNRDELLRALRGKTAAFGEGGVEGRVMLHMFVDEQGRVTSTRVMESSGHADMDEAAIAVAGTARFHPARKGDEAIGVWIALPFEFRTS